ncbi:nucleotidyltransferase domain-containing protein [uncultured Methanospirillum sp.]|uniref:nucleotidyltransferase family protein n=1 Tax=uncultured Methanospirillum sp. TaxID=262503 RepID=UPI0029C6A4D8|nr:nucleotidyltransferase domain-containing protein [uncultured Methanospirillum sp.]
MFDLSDEEYQLLLGILNEHLSGCRVYAFGSRVKGDHHPWSDLDLYIESDKAISSELKEALSESDIPIFVDLIDSQEVSPEFRETLTKVGMVLVATIE